METLQLTPSQSSPDFKQARRQATGKAAETLTDPVIIAWRDDNNGISAPEIPGASDDRWQDYASSNGGKLAVSVGDSFHFVFLEAADFDEPEINVKTLAEEDGTSILCFTGACTEDERRKMGYFAGGGTGG